jgi:alpha-D-ribose 1-methylphosphonate 5-triphosphate diphosphatase
VLLTNVLLVLPDRVLPGTLLVRSGVITEIQPGRTRVPTAIDLDGDYLLPGIVDLHTDNLERQVQPRGGVRWPSRSAFLAHDAQCAACGITTLLDSLCVGDLGFDEDREQTCREGIADLDALAPTDFLKAAHFLHLRCELPAPGMPDLLAAIVRHPLLRLVSLMDHTPGVGQYADLARYRSMRLRDGDASDVVEQGILSLQAQRGRTRGPNRAALLAMMRVEAPGVALASHDDRSAQDVAENLTDSIPIAEFPVTLDAARRAHAGGQHVIAGAPNLVHGGSHTGNVAASALLAEGYVDAWASDYVPASLVEAAFLAESHHGMSLPASVRLVSAAPAAMVGLADRGSLAPGQRADLVRVRLHEGSPIVRQVWRGGVRVI